MPFVLLPLLAVGLLGPQCLPNERAGVIAKPTSVYASPPFRVGERLQYSVSYGKVHVGSGEMALVGRDTVRGHTAWKAQLRMSGQFLMFGVHDTTTSWFDSVSFNTLHFTEGLHEPSYSANRDTQIFPERQTYFQRGDRELPSVADALDEISLVYLVRTLPLEPGQCYELQRYFKPDANPVVIHVVRRETIKVPAGEFKAIVLRPEIKTGGIFSQKGRAELWLSDDSARVVLQLKSQLPFGSINLYLTRATTSQ